MAARNFLIFCLGILGMSLAFAGECLKELASSESPHLPTLSPEFVAIRSYVDQMRAIESKLNTRNVYPRMTTEVRRKLEAELKQLQDDFIKYTYNHHSTIELSEAPLLEAAFLLRANLLVDKKLEDQSSEGKLQHPWLNELKAILTAKEEQIRRRIDATVFNQKVDEANAEAAARARRNPGAQRNSAPRSPIDGRNNRGNRDAWGAGAGLPTGDLD